MDIKRMKRTSIYFTDQQVKSFKILSGKTGLTSSELIRRAIDQFLQNNGSETNDREQQSTNTRGKKRGKA